jgi:exopolysaccharide biosynthesis polyprenyl glycosylphosphotransferase
VSIGADGIAEAARKARADAVMVLPCHHLEPARLRRLAWELEGTKTQMLVAPGLLDVAHWRATVAPVGALALLHVDHAELRGLRRVMKEAFDRIAAAAALVVLLPMLALLMLAVRCDSRGPVVFRQERVGKDDHRFMLLKLRTMVVDAEARRREMAGQNDAEGPLFKIRDDPRVTRIGRFLRRFSLDELPQLVNVLLGQMSLVGPRPPLPAEVERYDGDVRRRLAVKPGITGLWQVSGRSDLTWEEGVRLDLSYVENWSLRLDLVILSRTVRAVLAAEGAY